jgi:hypothetical protein
MDKSDWNTLLLITAAVILIAAVATGAAANRRWQLSIPLGISIVVSTTIYLVVMSKAAVGQGAHQFHLAAVIVICAAILLGVLLDGVLHAGQPLAYVIWSLLGACLPPVTLFLWLAAVCSGGACFE